MAPPQTTAPSGLPGRLRQFVARRPLACALLLTLATPVVALVALLAARTSPWLQRHPLSVGDLLLALLAAALLTALGWWRAAGFRRPARWRALYVLWLPALLNLPLVAGLAASGSAVADPATVALLGLTTFLVGFQEEALYRGIILRALLPGGRLRAVLLSALLFGLAHLAGLVLGKHALFVLVQVVLATGVGVCYAAIRLRTGTLWPLIIAHWLFNFLGSLAGPEGTLAITGAPPAALVIGLAALGLVYGGYGLFLQRHDWFPRARVGHTESRVVS